MAHMQDGDYREYSDIDIMILVDMDDMELKKYFNDIVSLSFDFDMKYDTNFSPILQDVNQFNYWFSAIPFYQNVINEGVILNG